MHVAPLVGAVHAPLDDALGGLAPLAAQPTTTGAANVEQLFAGNVQQLFGAFTNVAANPAPSAPVAAVPTAAQLAVAHGWVAPPGDAGANDSPMGLPATNAAADASPAIQPPAADPTAGAPQNGRCHNCGQDGHWAGECKLILSKMIAGRASKCALCPFVVQPNNDVIVKLGCGPFTYQWVHRPCAMQHLVTLGLL